MSKKLTITVKDEVYAHLSGLREQDTEFLFEKFSEYVEGYRYMNLFRLGRWNGKIPFFSREGKVYFRLLDEILPYLDGWGYDIELIDLRRPVELISTRVTADWFSNKPEIKNPITLRSYQVQGVNKALEAGSGIVIGGTGAGKTNMAAALCDAYNTEDKRCFVIVPSADLVEQTVKTFRDNNLDVGTYSGDSKDVHHMTVVATWQALQYNPALLESSGPKPIERVDVIIIDECVHPSTLIRTINGLVQIRHLKIGDEVFTINESSGEIELKPIIEVHKNLLNSSSEKRLKITLDNGQELIITGNHKVLTTSGWKRADSLKETDELV